MKHKLPRLVCLSSLFVVSMNVQAALIYEIDNRYTRHTHLGITPYGTVTPDAAFADFYDSRFLEAGVFQSSVLTATTISGTGSTSGTQDSFLQGAFATSYFDVTFSVDESTPFSLTGQLDADSYFGTLSVSLYENGINIFSYDPFDATTAGFVSLYSYSGQLFTGNTYQLVAVSADSELGVGYDEEWQLNLQISDVPIPAAVWLFASGLLGLVGMARRKSHIG